MNESATHKPATYCVIPAAGLSSRMAAWKPLLPWGATTICGAVVDTVLLAGLRPVLVAGYRGEELAESFADRPELAVVLNDDWALGMLGSIRTGVDFILQNCLVDGEGDTAGFFVVPADMPRVPAKAFSLISAALAGSGGAMPRGGASRAGTPGDDTAQGSVFPSRGGVLGHPVWIPAAFIPALRGLDPGSRLRDYLLGQPWTSVEVDDDGIFADLDTPEAYSEALRLNSSASSSK
ncbi:MAG: hypothetical protein A2Y38_04405 [Spirochaetes bacterium GWB1_59_5]|nr:MAG: hypothetical protein A2Y38_04405 [Spirochaetes bacterium GWB1_59_5]